MDRTRAAPVWVDQTTIQLDFQPLQTSEEVLVIGPSGDGLIFSKVLPEGRTNPELYRFSTEGKVSVQPGEFDAWDGLQSWHEK